MVPSRLLTLAVILAWSPVMAEDSLMFSVVKEGHTRPEKVCVIGFDEVGFWAVEQKTMDSFPAPKVRLEPSDMRALRYVDVLQMIDGKAAHVPAWSDERPDPPFMTLVRVIHGGETTTRREVYMAGLGLPPQVAFLFGDLGPYGMTCLPPMLR